MELAHKLLDTTLIHVNRKLVPNETPEASYMPTFLRQRLHELLYGGLLFDCDVQGEVLQVYQAELACGVHMAIMALPNKEGFLVVGPYLPDQMSELTIEEQLTSHGIALKEKPIYLTYLNSLPTIAETKLHSLFSMAASCWCENTVATNLKGFHLNQNAAPCPVFAEETFQLRAETLEKRYAQEHYILNMVMQGNTEAANQLGPRTFVLERLPNKLRNEKNLAIILNTLLRKSLEQVHVHPLYIDSISEKWATRIEKVERVTQMDALFRDMVTDYCLMVKRHSLANYSPNVRAMINMVSFNLSDPELSLRMIADHLGINHSHLSQHFNREVGCSLPDYIAEKRVEIARQLLGGGNEMSVGQVAQAVGFSDVNYFAKVFKKKVGCTPSAFRKK